jgi:adenosylmethionine-8-amino-7-oxononanoate aminotransferase
MSPDRASLVALDKRHVWHPYTPMDRYLAETDPLVVVGAEGAWLTDADGRRYLDANASWWVASLGHRHPALVAALRAQLDSLAHCALAGITHAPAARLAEELCALAPPGLSRVFYSDNGSTAVEVAVKMCGQYWAQNGRPARTRFIALDGAFHGETLGATSLGGVSAFTRVYAPWTFEVIRLPVADDALSWEPCLDAIGRILRAHGDEVAGVVVEPMVQGAAGMRMHPPGFLRAVRELTRAVDTFLIADEVFTGLWRTGRRWACDHADVAPDVLCLAKALSGAMLPFAATLTTERLFDGFRGDDARAFFYGHTYCGNPLAVHRDEDIPTQVARKAPRIAEAFARMANIPGVLRARSLGMIGALDLGGEGYLARTGWRVYEEARARGIYLRPMGDTVYVTPPLNIPDGDLALLLEGVEESVRAAL